MTVVKNKTTNFFTTIGLGQVTPLMGIAVFRGRASIVGGILVSKNKHYGLAGSFRRIASLGRICPHKRGLLGKLFGAFNPRSICR